MHRRRMSLPAIMLLDSTHPLNYIGSQTMVFLRPFMTFFFSAAEYDRVAKIMERREGPTKLIEAIEAAVAECPAGGNA